MIIDAHCHAWERWPYQPPVPDFHSRGRIEQLIHEMDANGVDRAFLVCAGIEHNPHNNDYIAAQVGLYGERIVQVADVDCSWSATYHRPGAALRLRQAAQKWPMRAFTHYLKHEDDGAWLVSEEGLAFFTAAVELKLIASIACAPHHHLYIQQVAERFPELPILIHHLGSFQVAQPESLKLVLASAKWENIYIKLSGFYYVTSGDFWDFPYRDTHDAVRAEYEHFGPRRMCWGSDYPVARRFMTYRQTVEAFRTYCDFVPEAEKEWIMGKNLDGLLQAGQ